MLVFLSQIFLKHYGILTKKIEHKRDHVLARGQAQKGC
jgi:hypothetical protein